MDCSQQRTNYAGFCPFAMENRSAASQFDGMKQKR